jgi:hypothetical protein
MVTKIIWPAHLKLTQLEVKQQYQTHDLNMGCTCKNAGLYDSYTGYIISILNYKKYGVNDPLVRRDICRKCGSDKETIQCTTHGCTIIANRFITKSH